jgi:hypothetical protein
MLILVGILLTGTSFSIENKGSAARLMKPDSKRRRTKIEMNEHKEEQRRRQEG